MKNIIRIRSVCAITIAIFIGFPFLGNADVGGGRGQAESPYLYKKATEDIVGVNGQRAQDAKDRFVDFALQSGLHIYGTHVGVAYVNGNTTFPNIDTAFTGIVNGETKSRSIDFSVIRYIKVISSNSDTITLRIDLFPDISTAELLNTRPSYIDMKEKYAKLITIRLQARSASGKKLALLGRDVNHNFPLRILAFFSDIPFGQEFELMGDNHWWAIGSVTDDLAYPNRVGVAK